MYRKCKRALLTVFAFCALLHYCLAAIPQEQSRFLAEDSSGSSLLEVRGKKRALLLVFKSGILDTHDIDRPIIELALKSDPKDRRYWFTYATLAKKLNAYIKKYKSMTAVDQLSDADYIVLFNLLEYRTVLNTTYPYGELFVVVKENPETKMPPRIIWKSRKVQWAGDAARDLIKEFRTVRGEM